MVNDVAPSRLHTVDLRSLVTHAHSVPATATIEQVQAVFAREPVDFIAVVKGPELIGACARRDIGRQLSTRYGFALFAARPVTEILLRSPLRITCGTSLASVFLATASRSAVEFFDDVLLVDDQGHFLGMIPMQTLVRLQTQFLMEHNAEIEASRAEIVAKNKSIQEDLAMAREVQLALLPAAQLPFCVGDHTLSIAHRYRPAGEMSGDFFDVLRVSDRATGILVCDVMGHGVRSALITAMARAMIEELRPFAGEPGKFLTRLNHGLTRILRRTAGLIFVTAAYAVVDVASGKLRYAQAGHPPPVRFFPAEKRWFRMSCPSDVEGPALGLIDDFIYSALETPFESGSRLLMFTDGLTEAADRSGEEFGAERLARTLGDYTSTPLEQMLDATLAAASKFSNEPLADDICLVAVELAASVPDDPMEVPPGREESSRLHRTTSVH